MSRSDADREQAMKELAKQLLFTVERHGGRFSLCRDADIPNAVRRDNLTLDEAEELLETWKLRGFHGG
jgi:hypothetical protein